MWVHECSVTSCNLVTPWTIVVTLCDSMDSNPLGSSVPWNSTGKNIAVGCHFLLQGGHGRLVNEHEQ